MVGQGERPVDVAKVLGVSRRTVYRALGTEN
jgi:DNA-binding CsgD family transcriptional regulator